MPRSNKDQTPHPKKKTKQKKSKQLEEKQVEEDKSIVISDTEDTDYFESSQLSNSINNREPTPIDLDADKSTLSNGRHFSRSFASFEDQPVLYRSSPERTDNIMKTILKTPSPLQFSKPPKLRRFLSNESNISNISLASSYHFLNSQEMEEERRLFFGGDDEEGSSGNESLGKNNTMPKLNSSALSTITASSSNSYSKNRKTNSNLLPLIQYYSTILIYISISLVALYFSLLFIYSFHQDYNWRYIEAIKYNKLKIIECERRYNKNSCFGQIPRVLIEECKLYDICRNRSENHIKRTKLISEIFGDVASGFIKSFSYKAILFYFLFGCILLILIKWVLVTKEPTIRIVEVEKKRN